MPSELFRTVTETKMGLLNCSETPRRPKWGYWTVQNRHGDPNGATELFRTTAETKMELLNCSKPSRRPKWGYWTVQNGRGDQNDATELFRTAAETKMTLLNCSKPPRRQKWRYWTVQNHLGRNTPVPQQTNCEWSILFYQLFILPLQRHSNPLLFRASQSIR